MVNYTPPAPHRRRLLVRAMLAAAIAAVSPGAFAQSYPDRAVRLIVPAPAGGPTDILARVIGEKLSTRWQQPVIVENKPGATQTLGTAYVARSAPDGYTLLMLLDATVTMLPTAMKNLPYDRNALTPVMTLVNVPGLLAVGRTAQSAPLSELFQAAKAKPGQHRVRHLLAAGANGTAQRADRRQVQRDTLQGRAGYCTGPDAR